MSAHFDQIKSSLDDFCAAWKTNDGASLGGFFVEDGTLINPFGQRADGRAAVAAMYSEFFAGMLGGTSTTVDLASVRPIGDDHAFADGQQTINSPDGSTVLEVHIAALLRRDGDDWRFVDARPYTVATIPD
jgi:uncharacterized protein (TIGR02246 family)